MISEWRDGAAIPVRFTCAGAGAQPRIAWRGVPRGARELVLVVTDPDAPGGRFVHWTAYGIAPGARAVPPGVREGANSAGKDGWTPPCPPEGDRPHRYVIELYALPRRSGLPAG
ncbi:MAG TPA: YbhB/YbcL family Raf kinase inhibitor-like protein, partial [Solirubrobacteraceae bacterium]